MPKVYILKWLPWSGKSTRAEEYMKENKAVRLNKDLARKQYYFKKYDSSLEEFVLNMRNLAILEALWLWYDVIVDDTNFKKKHEEDIKQLVYDWSVLESTQVEVKVKFINTWPETSKRRNNNRRSHCVPNFVIDEMYEKAIEDWLTFKEQEDWYKYKWDNKLPKAYIFDIDWTLAKMTTRSPYDYSEELMTDILNQPVFDIYKCLVKDGYKIIIFTGRKNEGNEWTQKWIQENGIFYTEFMCRQDEDDRNDAIIKREFFETVKDKYNIQWVFDDRDRVVDMWRSLWLTCYQVWYWSF